MGSEEPFFEALGAFGPALLGALSALEQVGRRLQPDSLPRLRQALAPLAERLGGARASFEAIEVPDAIEPLRAELLRAAGHAGRAVEGIATPGDIGALLEAMSQHCRALEALFPLRTALPPVSRFFVEPPFGDELERLDPDPPTGAEVGLLRGRGDDEGRGGFHLYVPEHYDGSEAWPLVFALHGGSGSGRDFLWTWLREARGRGFLLVAPTSQGPTWSFNGPDVDAPMLDAIFAAVAERWEIDRDHVLLTGLSDGATYSLVAGLRESSPFTHLAPLSGVLHPVNYVNGNLERARGKPIYLVHGALDWMFPVQVARAACEAFEQAGAALVYRELEDLSHAYAREQNDPILEWFDPRLALPNSGRGSAS
jgi:phospholipase/carboxylesterase